MLTDLFEQVEKDVMEMPSEIGTEVIHQMKGDDKTNQQKQQSQQPQGDDANQQQHLLDQLYGKSSLTPEQMEQKRQQDIKIMRQRYQQIQQDIQEYRAKKQQEVRKDEIGQQQGLETARTQEDKMELWEKQQKEAEKKKKEQEEIRMPGSAASRSGEQQKIMG